MKSISIFLDACGCIGITKFLTGGRGVPAVRCLLPGAPTHISHTCDLIQGRHLIQERDLIQGSDLIQGRHLIQERDSSKGVTSSRGVTSSKGSDLIQGE